MSGSRNTILRGSPILPPLQKQMPVRSLISVLKNDYAFIFFYSNNCHHCKIFHPVLKLYSDNSGILVKAFAIGDRASTFFPNSTVVVQEVINRFFGKGAKVSVPTLFIINKNNLHAYPVSRGALTYLELSKRMDELTPKILKNEKSKENEKSEANKKPRKLKKIKYYERQSK